MKRAKNYKKIAEATNKATDLKSYLDAVCANNPYKYDQSVELKISVKRSSKNPTPYKVSLTFPNNFGKSVKVLALCEGEDAKKALASGADYAGLDEYMGKINDENWSDFDIVIATPAVMPKIAKLGRVLGAKGLMPNPKTGTVSNDIEATVKEFKAGKKNFKEDKTGVINTVVGKVSMGSDKLLENIKALVGAMKEASPNVFNDVYTIYIKTTMGPSIKVAQNELMN